MKWKTCLKYETWNGSSPSQQSDDDDETSPTEHFARVEIGWLLLGMKIEFLMFEIQSRPEGWKRLSPELIEQNSLFRARICNLR